MANQHSTPFDVDEQIERIHNLRYESEKFHAEVYKLLAEGNKLKWDRWLLLIGVGVAAVSSVITLIKLFHG